MIVKGFAICANPASSAVNAVRNKTSRGSLRVQSNIVCVLLVDHLFAIVSAELSVCNRSPKSQCTLTVQDINPEALILQKVCHRAEQATTTFATSTNPSASPASGSTSVLGGRPPNGSTAFSFVPGSNTGAKRLPMQPQGLGRMGTGSVRTPGKSRLTSNHILG